MLPEDLPSFPETDHDTPITPGQALADLIAGVIGSWTFVGTQSVLFLAWMIWNSHSKTPLDPFPYILLNLVLSFSAAYANSIILMAQNRQVERDRVQAKTHYLLTKKSEAHTQTIINLMLIQSELIEKLVKEKEQ